MQICEDIFWSFFKLKNNWKMPNDLKAYIITHLDVNACIHTYTETHTDTHTHTLIH